MSSKIKVDTIENVAGSGNVSLGSGHNLVVPGNETVGGTLGVTGTSTLATTNISGNITQTKSDTALAHFKTTATNTYSEVLIEDGNAGYAWQTRSDNAQSTSNGDFLLNDRRGTFPIIIEENNPTNTLKLSNGRVLMGSQPSFMVGGNNAAWVSVSSGSTAIIEFDGNVSHNVGNHYSTANDRFVVPVAGRYLFVIHAYVDTGGSSNDSGPYGIVLLRKNGSNIPNVNHIFGYLNAPDHDQHASFSAIVELAANDYIQVGIQASGGGAVRHYGTSSVFSGHLLG